MRKFVCILFGKNSHQVHFIRHNIQTENITKLLNFEHEFWLLTTPILCCQINNWSIARKWSNQRLGTNFYQMCKRTKKYHWKQWIFVISQINISEVWQTQLQGNFEIRFFHVCKKSLLWGYVVIPTHWYRGYSLFGFMFSHN